ncbi:MAG: SpoIIE family protein phosphatase [Pseudomonadota bacterium]|nr:SpoIIE family protein phosphatase [Pseudomonadota bacterium]
MLSRAYALAAGSFAIAMGLRPGVLAIGACVRDRLKRGRIADCDHAPAKAAERALKLLNQEQRAILDSEMFGIALIRERHFVWTNPGLDRILGHDTGVLAGQSTRLMYPDEEAYLALGAQAYPIIRCDGTYRGEQALVRRGGAVIWVEMTGTCFNHDPDAALWMFVDVTARRTAEAALRKSQAMLARTGAVAGVGGWELDIASGVLDWSEETCRISGAAPDYQPTLDEAVAFYAPEDRPTIVRAVETALAGGPGFDLELRYVRVDGKPIWVRAVGTVEYADGRPQRLVGAFQDISLKVEQLRRIEHLYEVSERQRVELTAFRDHAESEADLASFLLSRLCHVEQLNSIGVSYHWVPAETFSGDVIAVAASSSGDRYAMLADATGHGLAAAIHLIPLTSGFNAMAAKGFNLVTIADHLNRIVKDYSLPDRFVAVTLARWVSRENRLEVVNAGNPGALLLDGNRQILREFKSGSIPLGILDLPKFKPVMEVVELLGNEELLLFSDGLVEASDACGEPFGSAGVQAALASPAAGMSTIEAVRAGLALHAAAGTPVDDISVLVLRPSEFAGRRALAAAADLSHLDPHSARRAAAADAMTPQWRIATTFSWMELRKIEVVPVLVELTGTFGLNAAVEAPVFTVLSELFVNALEHGLLRLDSAIKSAHDGFERYLSLREKRLRNLREGEITVVIQHTRHGADSGVLRIEVHDSGDGFDHRAAASRAGPGAVAAAQASPSGRGLMLLNALCDSLSFNEQGNSVAVELSYS